MRFDTARCLHCGSPAQTRCRTFGEFWFCSELHYMEEIWKLLPDEWRVENMYDHPKGKELIRWVDNAKALLEESDDPFPYDHEYKFEEYEKWFTEQCEVQWRSAETQLISRIEAEVVHKKAEQEAKDRLVREKEEEKAEQLREKEKQQREEAEAQLELLKPQPIPEKIRFEHTHILGPSGSGKTTLLQNNVLQDFLVNGNINPNPPAYIIIDPKGLMVERLSKLNVFANHYKDRIVIVDPFDAPALNLFQTAGRSASQLISDFGYIFSTTKQKMTGKQNSCFSFCARMLFTLPQANLFTLLDLLDDRTHKKPPNPLFQNAIPHLPPVAKRFFETDFYSPNYASTREEIKSRIYGVLENDILSAMLNAKTRKLDIAKCIRERKILLVNTRMTQLKEAHQTLGRYIIALAQDAIQSRAERHPVYLVCDEYQEFCDPQKTPEGLRLLREYGGGAVLAHQNMYCAELDDDTRNAISTNTSIKYASSPEGQDLNYMARDLRCDAEFLKATHKSNTHARFACFARGMNLQHPFIVEEEFGWIEKWPKMSEDAYKALRASNKAALADTHEGPSDAERSHVTMTKPAEAGPLKTDPGKYAPSPVKSNPKPSAQAKPVEQPQAAPSADPTDAGGAASDW
jgi:hypothetical protein